MSMKRRLFEKVSIDKKEKASHWDAFLELVMGLEPATC